MKPVLLTWRQRPAGYLAGAFEPDLPPGTDWQDATGQPAAELEPGAQIVARAKGYAEGAAGVVEIPEAQARETAERLRVKRKTEPKDEKPKEEQGKR